MTRTKNFVSLILSEHLIWLILIAVALFGTTVTGFLTTRNLLNVLWAAAPLGCMVLGMYFVMLTGALDLSIESTFALAPTIAILFMNDWMPDTVSPELAILITLVVGMIVGLANGFLSVTLRVNPFLVTLATLLVMRGIVIYLIPEGVYYLNKDFTYLGRVRTVYDIPLGMIVLLVLYLIAYIVIEHHSFGKSIYAIGNNEEAAYVAGINISRVKILTFVYAGLFAALGGLLEVGRLQSVVADLGEGDIMMVFAGAILGGTSLSGGEGRVTGIFASVLVLSFIENIMNLIGIEPSIRQVAFGVILLIAIVIASLQARMKMRTG